MDATALHGTFPAAVTPLTEAREVDLDDVAVLVHQALADGAAGLLVAGSTGEGTLLEPLQRVALTRAAVAAADGAGVVLAGASGLTVEALIADVRALADAGADAVLVLAPHTYPLAPDELVDLHHAVADAVDVPMLAYHIPQLTGSALDPESMAALTAHPRIIGVKDSSPDADRRAAFARTVGVGTTLLTGHAPTVARALDDGVGGAILAVGNVRQRTVTALVAAHAAGEVDAVARHQETLTATAFALAELPASTPAVLKAAMQLQGTIAERWCRPPLRSVDARRLDRVRTALLR